MNKRGHSKQNGYVLFTVVVMLFVVAVAALLVSYDSSLKASMPAGEAEASRADYVADAAMQHALWRSANNACMGGVTIPTTSLGSDSYTAAITGAATGTAYTLAADQDAWIRSDDVTKNNGTTADQHLRFETGNVEQALTRFDLSSLPANAQINSATAWFYLKSTSTHPEGKITVHRVTTDWTELGATWQTMDGQFETSTLATIPAQSTGGVWVSINLTAQVQAWVNGQSNQGILFRSEAEGLHAMYMSREDAGNPPRLDVVVGSGPPSPVNIQATGTLANGNTRSLTRVANPAYQPPVIHTFSPDPAESDDAEIWNKVPNNNYGDRAETWVSSVSNDTTRSLLRFNMGAIPTGARILGATLSVHRQSGSGADQPVSAHRIVNSWSEGSVTWNSRDSGANWDTAGGDFDAMAVATTPVGPVNQPYEWDVTPLVQGWVDGSYSNYGVALIAAIDGMPGERFYTSDQAILDRRPSLSVTYACECGSACMAPQGTGNLLLVIGSSPASPAAKDVSVRDYLESWGYTVTLIEDDDSKSNFTAAAGATDVVFISESVTANNVGIKLTDVPVGVVSAEGNLNSELGIATNNNRPASNVIDVVDNSHYITQIFPATPLQFKTQSTQLLTVSGTVAAGAQMLADIGGAGSLVAIDQGAVLGGDVTGQPAAGRRVMIPVGEADTDWRYLTNNGRLVVQRAIAWGMNADFTLAGNLLMVVGNDAGLTTQEQVKKSLLESWGYLVNLIDEDDSQGEFDTAFAVNDVVFVTEDAQASDIGTKLTGATIGVVIEEANLTDELGLSASINWSSGTDILISDNSHYITSPFAIGSLTILSSVESLAHVISAQAPDLSELALNQSGLFGLVTLEADGTTHTGGSAAGRRAMLPWGGNDMDVNHLTADGLTIMQRAIEWGGGAGVGGGTTYAVLMVVADPSSLNQPAADRKTLMESWGYTVTLIDSDDTSANFISAIDVADVVYIGSGTSPTDVLTKVVTNIAIGVVNEPISGAEILGFASSWTVASVDQLANVDSTHYITEGLANPVTVFTTSKTTTTLSGTFSPDLQNLAEAGAAPAIAVLETGARKHDVGATPGRRAQLPFASAEGSDLTVDGQLIVQRAIEWAAGAGGESDPIAHWKLDDGAGTTAIDSVGGNDGTLVNMDPSTDWVPGQLSGGLDFDGANDYVDVSSMNPMSYDDFTIIAWYKSADTSVSDDEYIFVHDDSFVDELTFGPTDDVSDKLRLGINRGGTWDPHYGTSDIVDQQWHHLVGVRAGGRIMLYVDNVKETDEADALAGLTVTIDGDGPFIGDYPGVTEQVHGILDDVRLYDRGLTDAEIADLFTAGGGYDVLLIVGNDTTLSSKDVGYKALMESWGHTVAVLDDGASQASYDTAMAAADVIYASGSAVGSSMLDKATNTTKGLVNEVVGKIDNFGFSSSTSATANTDNFSLTNPGHYITQPFGGNPVTIFTASLTNPVPGGTLAPDLQNVGEITGTLALGTLDAGATGWNGNPVPARRAHLPFASAETDDMTADGKTILQRAIEWAAGGGGGGGGGGGSCDGTFRDEFNARNFTGSDGTLTWAGDWLEVGETGGATAGDIQVMTDQSNYQLRTRDNDNGGEGVEREADLSGAAGATLSYDYRRTGLDSTGDYTAVEVSANGAAGPWIELTRHDGTGNDSSYQPASHNISGYISNNTRIRFKTSSTMGRNDAVFFDNVEIACTP